MAGVDILATAFSGANAAFLADLYARWADNPASVDPSFAELFAALNDDAARGAEDATGASWAPRPSCGFAPKPEARRAKAEAAAPRSAETARRHACRHALRALMLIRSYRVRGHLEAQLDPLGLQIPEAASGARPAVLRLHRRRLGPADLHRQRARPRDRHAARDHGDPARDLLRPDRRRVHAYPGPRPEVLDPAQGRRRALAQRVRRRAPSARSCSSSPRPKASRRSARSAMSPPSGSAWRAARSPSRRCTRSSRRRPRRA